MKSPDGLLRFDYSVYSAPSFGEQIEDIVVQGAAGVGDAINETIEFADDVATWAEDLGIPNLYFQILNEDGDFDPAILTVAEVNDLRAEGSWQSLQLPDLPPPNTRAGQLIRGFTHFAASYLGAGKLLRIWRPATATGRMSKAQVQGFIGDFVAYDPLDERFSNWLSTDLELGGLVTEFLAADPDDSDALGRFKNGLEGMGIGLIADGLSSMILLARSNAVVRVVQQLPGADRAFARSVLNTPANANRAADHLSAATLSSMSAGMQAVVGRAFSTAVGRAGEIYAGLRLNTWSRTLDPQVRVSIGNGRHARPDYGSTPNFLGVFLGKLGLETSETIAFEIKTGAARLTRNQRIYEAQLAQAGKAHLFQLLRVPLSAIPNGILIESMRKYLDAFHVPGNVRDLIINELKSAQPDLQFIYLIDFMARGLAEEVPLIGDTTGDAPTAQTWLQ